MRFFPVIFALTLPLAFASFDLLPLGLSEKEAIAQSSQISKYRPSNQSRSAYGIELKKLLEAGEASVGQSAFQNAIAIYQKALALTKKSQNLEDQSTVLSILGRVYDESGKYLQAEKSFLEGLKIIGQTSSNSPTKIYLYSGLGRTYQNIGKYDKAAENLQRAVRLSDKIKADPELFLFTHLEPRFYLGETYRDLRNYQKAIDLFQECYTLAVRSGDREQQAISLTALGNTYVLMNDLNSAREFYNRARQLGNFQNNPSIGDSLARLNALTGEMSEIAQTFEIFIPVLQRMTRGLRRISEVTVSDPSFAYIEPLANRLENTTQKITKLIPRLQSGNIFQSIGMMQELITEVISLQNELNTGSTNTTGSIAELDESCNTVNSLSNSFKPDGKKPNISTKLSPEAISVILDVMQDMCKVTKSLNEFNNKRKEYVEKFRLKEFDIKSIIDRMEESDRKRSQRSEKIYLEAAEQQLSVAKKSGNSLDYGKALNVLANAYKNKKNYLRAEQALLEAISIWEKLRVGLEDQESYRISLLETQTKTYQDLQEVRIAMQKYPEALEAAEQGRARAFLALLSAKLSSDRTQQYIEPSVTAQQLQQIAKEQNLTIVSYSLIRRITEFSIQSPVGTTRLYVWVVSPKGEVAFRDLDLMEWEFRNGNETLLQKISALQKPLNRPSGTYRSNLRIPNPRKPIPEEEKDDIPSELKELYRLLIQPIEEFLPKDPESKVVFVPHDALFLVPFAALREQSGKYLIEKHTISYSPSIQVLASTKELANRPKGKEILIIGNPSGDLKNAEQEAQDIAKLLNSIAMIGKEATKTKVLDQISQAKIIHLAMHGIFDGLDSWLDFGSQIKLTAKEALELNLKADLVVLSACSTGQGVIKSDGVIGLSRSFILAGTPRIIVSLWSVPDAATGKLIVNFYQNIQKNSDYSQSLRQAMLTTMKEYPHPRNWAAFGLFGASN